MPVCRYNLTLMFESAFLADEASTSARFLSGPSHIGSNSAPSKCIFCACSDGSSGGGCVCARTVADDRRLQE
jgi:hypothetical protein